MNKSIFFRILLTLTSLIAASLISGKSSAQENVGKRAPVRNQPPPRIDSERHFREFERTNKFEGLYPLIARKIAIATRGSIVEIFDTFGKGLVSGLQLDATQSQELEEALKKRAKMKVSEQKKLFRELANSKGEISERAIQKAVQDLLEKDAENDLALTFELESILDPIQVGKVCKVAMGDFRPDFARVPLVSRHLKLTPEQQTKYEACRLANVEFASEAQQVKGLDKAELDASYERLAEKPKSLMVEADNSLDEDQFLFVARAVGFVKEGESLKQFFERQPKEEQARLANTLKVFRVRQW